MGVPVMVPVPVSNVTPAGKTPLMTKLDALDELQLMGVIGEPFTKVNGDPV